MKRYPLPKEYVKELNEHRYVEQATEWTVSFTAEFKQLAYDEYYRGKSMREIFTEAGFDVEKPIDSSHIGIANVRNRVETLAHGRLEIVSEIGKGTTATIRLPITK